jgi:hypothetical protein
MASRVVKQPNGLYARWSDVVDQFTCCNMTRAEMIALYMHEHNMSTEDAIAKVGRADYEPERLGDELLTVRWRHGYRQVVRTLQLMQVDPRKWRRGFKNRDFDRRGGYKRFGWKA